VHKEIKISILLCLIVIILYKILLNKLHIQKDIALLFMISMLFGSFFIFNGVMHSNPGAIPSIGVILIWPFLYILFIGANGYKNIFVTIDRVLLFSAYFIPIYGLYFLFGKESIIPSSYFIDIFPPDVMGGVGLYKGSIEVSILTLASLLFLGPYIFTKFILSYNMKDKFIYGLSIILILVLVFLSNRRALVLVVLFSPVLIFFLSFLINKKNLLKKSLVLLIYIFIFLILIISIISIIYQININEYLYNINEAIDFSKTTDPSTIARINQFYALVEGWEKLPLIGNGFGAVASVIRNSQMPWAYELSYMALLFHTGIIGVLIYFLLILWIVINGVKISKNIYERQYMFPYLIGMISFLIGNISNPYLMKFDYLWVIFLPIMYINYYKLTHRVKA